MNGPNLDSMIVGSWITQAIYVAAELGIADLLKQGPRTAAELAPAVGAHGASLYRLLRALASVGIFQEDGGQRFSLSPLGELLVSDVPGSKRSLARMAGCEFYRSWGGLLGSVRTGNASFDEVFGQRFFDYMNAHGERWQIYDDAMTGIHDLETIPVLEAYDFSSLDTLVDVGGGSGLALAAILKQYPAMRGVLFDLPQVVNRARRCLEGRVEEGRCVLIEGDFFASIPAADGYLLRHILHDWEDAEAVAILKNCRQAMRSGSVLLVVETLIPGPNQPCFGKWLDLMMLVVGGRERTLEQYAELLAAAGLRLARVIPTSHEVSVVEAVPAA